MSDWFRHLPAVAEPALPVGLVPLLALPRSTHRVHEGFIWRQRAT